MTTYRRTKNSGPVAYPDGSGRYLIDEMVQGDEWEALVPLEFVEQVSVVLARTEEVPPVPVVEPAPALEEPASSDSAVIASDCEPAVEVRSSTPDTLKETAASPLQIPSTRERAPKPGKSGKKNPD